MAANTATDSAKELNQLIGDDATATFESNPTFVDSNPGGAASSENSVSDEDSEQMRDTDDTADSDEEVREADQADPDSDSEDTTDEVGPVPTLSADGLLGQEDELDDTKEKRDRPSGDAAREKSESKIKDGDSTDDDAGDVARGVDEDKLDEDDMDTDQVAAPALHAMMAAQNAAIVQSYVRV